MALMLKSLRADEGIDMEHKDGRKCLRTYWAASEDKSPGHRVGLDAG